jgi:antitoxin VapB
MQVAHLFSDGNEQAVRIPEKYQFTTPDVYIQKVGDVVMLFPQDKDWEIFLHGLHGFSDDFIL